MILKLAICIAFCLASFTLFAIAADPPATQSIGDSPRMPATSPSLRDPTEADPALKRAMEGSRTAPAGKAKIPATPQITRRGLVVIAGKAEALVEVQGAGSFFIHDGSVITVSTADGNTIMRVSHVAADEIQFEIASPKQTLIVR